MTVLRALATAHRHLAELKGRAPTVPNPAILIDTLTLQEAKASSEIENIVTTQDALFRADFSPHPPGLPAAKEVTRYRSALKRGADRQRQLGGLITNNLIIDIYQILKDRSDGFRTTPGTALINDASGETVYVPPQNAREIVRHMTALERFINTDDAYSLDPLIKMALIHHQFESIHPFPDGNGRVGRILNVLYLVHTGLLDIPILYLSRAITRSKSTYYRLLQAVREHGAWEDWVLYMLNAVAETSRATLELVEGIRKLMADYKHNIRNKLPRLYSQDLLNNLFRYPYTRVEYIQHDLGVTRQTAARYLDRVASEGFVRKQRMGRINYYINTPLVALFVEVSDGE